MPKGKKGHYTPHICVPITNTRRNIPSHRDQQDGYRLQHSVLDSFHSEIQGPVFLSVGPDAKLDMLKTFDLNKLFDLYLDPLHLKTCHFVELCKMATILLSQQILPTPPKNNKVTASSPAAAASNLLPDIPADPLQPSKIQLHSWQLYIPEAPVLDLRGKIVTATLDLADTFHELCLCSTDSDQQEESSPNARRKR